MIWWIISIVCFIIAFILTIIGAVIRYRRIQRLKQLAGANVDLYIVAVERDPRGRGQPPMPSAAPPSYTEVVLDGSAPIGQGARA